MDQLHSVHQCRTLIDEYLRKIKYKTKFKHKFTDGRSAQYKSRHCKGDVSLSVTDLRYLTIRNFCETSHAKRPQDGAGVNLKHKADMAIIKKQVLIQNARDLFKFAEEKMKDPAPS